MEQNNFPQSSSSSFITPKTQPRRRPLREIDESDDNKQLIFRQKLNQHENSSDDDDLQFLNEEDEEERNDDDDVIIKNRTRKTATPYHIHMLYFLKENVRYRRPEKWTRGRKYSGHQYGNFFTIVLDANGAETEWIVCARCIYMVKRSTGVTGQLKYVDAILILIQFVKKGASKKT
jgi:hypothetical protein